MHQKQSQGHSHSSWISIGDDYSCKDWYEGSVLEDASSCILLVKAVRLICLIKSAVRLAAYT